MLLPANSCVGNSDKDCCSDSLSMKCIACYYSNRHFLDLLALPLSALNAMSRAMVVLGLVSSWVFAFYASGLTNITVDDTDGSITYSLSNGWHQCNTCSVCLIKPHASQAFNGTWTWHDSTIGPGNGPYTVQVPFSGEESNILLTSDLQIHYY